MGKLISKFSIENFDINLFIVIRLLKDDETENRMSSNSWCEKQWD